MRLVQLTGGEPNVITVIQPESLIRFMPIMISGTVKITTSYAHQDMSNQMLRSGVPTAMSILRVLCVVGLIRMT